MDRPPYNETAERAVAGSLLFGDDQSMAAMGVLQGELRLGPRAFYDPLSRAVVATAFAMFADGKHVDLVTVMSRLEAEGALAHLPGGPSGVQGLVDSATVHARAVLELGREVRREWLRRRTVEVAREVTNEALDPESEPETVLAGASERFATVAEPERREETTEEVLDRILKRWDEVEQGARPMDGIPTGLSGIDKHLGGLKTGLYLVAARPGCGKTSFETQVSDYVAREGYPVARVTVDLDRERVLKRQLSMLARVSLPKLEGGYSGAKNKQSCRDAAAVLAQRPQWILEKETNLLAICSWIRMQRMRHGIALATIDYVQQLDSGLNMGRNYNEHLELTHISKRLKALACDLEIPILLLSQFSREVDKLERAPKLSDLRGSGSLEQDARACVFLYKQKPFDYDKARYRGAAVEEWKTVAEVIDVAKNQDGGTGTMEAWFLKNYFWFEEAEPDWGCPEALESGKGKKKG